MKKTKEEKSGRVREESAGCFSPGAVVVHAADTPLADAAVMRSGWSVGFAAAAYRPTFTTLRR